MERKKTNPSQHNWSLTIEQTQYNEEKVDFSTSGARTTGLPRAKKKKIWDILHNNQHNMDHKLKFKSLDDHGFGKDFLDTTQKVWSMKG